MPAPAHNQRPQQVRRRQPQMQRPTVSQARRPPAPVTRQQEPKSAAGWIKRKGGFDALSDVDQEVARRNYDGWKQRRPRAAEDIDIYRYVTYVQEQQAIRASLAEDQEHDQEQEQDAPAAIRPTDEDLMAKRRASVRARILAGQYDDRWMPASLARRLDHVELDHRCRTAILHLRCGARLIDAGDKLEFEGRMNDDAARMFADAAVRLGWQRVSLTGSADFRDSVTLALSLREPPIPTDHQLSPGAQRRLSEAKAVRARQRMPPAPAPDELARLDPAAAALARIEGQRRIVETTLAGRPTGELDPSAIAKPRLATLTSRRDTAAEEAREARELAAEHKARHGFLERHFPGPTRRRQKALDREAARSEREANILQRSFGGDSKRIERESRREVKAALALLEDWQYSTPVAKARRQIAGLDALVQAVRSGDRAIIDLINAGNWPAAGRQAETLARRSQAASDPRSVAMSVLMTAESRIAHDPDQLAAARRVTAAAMAGDPTTLDAAACGDLEAATRAAEEHQRRQEEQRRAARDRDRQQDPELASGQAYR